MWNREQCLSTDCEPPRAGFVASDMITETALPLLALTTLKINCHLELEDKNVCLTGYTLFIPSNTVLGHRVHPETCLTIYWVKASNQGSRLVTLVTLEDEVWLGYTLSSSLLGQLGNLPPLSFYTWTWEDSHLFGKLRQPGEASGQRKEWSL